MKKRLPSIFNSRKSWAEYFELRRTNEPHVHQIEPTNHCPYTCVMCPRTEKMTRETGFMDMELYYKIIDEINLFKEPVRSKEIELFHFGESLIHPQLDEMIRYASNKRLNIVLSINPPDLSHERAIKILEANPSKLIISLDGYDNDSYREIRGKKANYDKAIDNIEFLLDNHTKMNSNSKIIIRMIEFKLNKAYTQKFKEQWQTKNVELEIREFFPWTEKDLVDLGEVKKWRPFMPCPFPWEYVVIQYNGDIVPCCRDYDAKNKILNVKEHTLTEIWNSKEYIDFRNQHITGDYKNNDFCKDCMDIYYTEES